MKHDGQTRKLELFLLVLLVLSVGLLAQNSWSFSQGTNNKNVSVDTQVNITGSTPEILSVALPSPITLNAGTTTFIECNATIRDYNGYNDLNFTTAELFSVGSSSYGAADNNNTHYSNDSCTRTAQDGAFANFTCGFTVNYYAINDTWNCTVFVNDTIGLNDTNFTTMVISEVLAINVTPLIDYGDMAMGDTSSDIQANVSNVGNAPINVSVRGYGATPGDGLSMVCDVGTLTVDLQHYAANNTASYAEKQILATGAGQIAKLTVAKATDATGSLNNTYWQLYLDPLQNSFGLCNGTVVFQAETPT
ncbi:hypothetical protein GOV11_03085 [Candidatus Woesearchaeota archaeon]|nr:hypothetical protein [Candidatus Woesearchaeota archaeon]